MSNKPPVLSQEYVGKQSRWCSMQVIFFGCLALLVFAVQVSMRPITGGHTDGTGTTLLFGSLILCALNHHRGAQLKENAEIMRKISLLQSEGREESVRRE